MRPDIGADEFTATPLYRSVGITATPLASGAANALTISGSTATFGVALANNIGVGDAIQYDSDGNGSIDALAFIHGRTSSQSYTVKNKSWCGTDGCRRRQRLGHLPGLHPARQLGIADREHQHQRDRQGLRHVDGHPRCRKHHVRGVLCGWHGPGLVTINGWNTSIATYIDIFTPV